MQRSRKTVSNISFQLPKYLYAPGPHPRIKIEKKNRFAFNFIVIFVRENFTLYPIYVRTTLNINILKS